MALPGTETIRFRRPTAGPNAVAPKAEEKDQFGKLAPQGWKRRHQGLLQDKLLRQSNGPMVPSFSVALRLLLLIRTAAAMYSIISDCDEVFNFYEPLHYFQHNSGFQTWELSPQYGIRSWAYILLHWPLSSVFPRLLRLGKRQQFFAIRIGLGFISSFCEAKFYRAIVDTVNERVGRYVLFSLLLSAGMWSSAVAFLPSTFSMYTTMIACSFWFHPATSTPTGTSRAIRATVAFAAGAIVGWPFTAVLGVPFVIEQLFLTGDEVAVGQAKTDLTRKRFQTMVKAVLYGAAIAIPVYLVDSWAYGRPTFPTFNIIRYNLFSTHGANLYGTSPASFYFANLFLNFNYLLPFALISLPAVGLTYVYDRRRLGRTQQAPKEGETSPYTLLVARLAPFYIWLVILTLQAHKEERFAFPIYPLLCFNAAVGVYLVKGFLENVYIKITKSPYQAGRSTIFTNFSLFAILFPAILSFGRIAAMHQFYRAPVDIALHVQYKTVPDILTSLGYSPKPLPANYRPYGDEVPKPEWDYSPLQELEKPVTLCYGSEWYRYPGSYLIPEGIDVRWIKSEFEGIMPRKWEPSGETMAKWPRGETRVVREGRFNDANLASKEHGTFIEPEQCDYLVSLSLPSQKPSAIEPDWTSEPGWEKEYCTKFLDAASTKWWARIVWVPGGALEKARIYGDYCLLKRKQLSDDETRRA